MPDVYLTIRDADPAVVASLADVLEIRAADPQQRAMRDAYLADVSFPPRARVLEVGCGTGAVARTLAARSDVAVVVGCDLSPILLERARELAAGSPHLAFQEADGQALPFPDRSFDVVVFHTVLCHLADPARALAEAHRVLNDGGQVAIFDGDYSTTSVAIAAHDPLQATVAAAVDFLVHDPWLARRLLPLVREAGFTVVASRSHAYVQTEEPTYLLTLIALGADIHASAGVIGPDLVEALKAESRRRAVAGRFYGHIAYASVVARRCREQPDLAPDGADKETEQS